MKYLLSIILSLNLFAQTDTTNWYIDRDATGSNNGTSWTDAWVSPNSISWGSIEAGDTIYVSGGTDSTIYKSTDESAFVFGNTSNASPAYTYASGNTVVICPSWEANHNGDVYFFAIQGNRRILEVGNLANLKITGFKFWDSRTSEPSTAALIKIGNADWGDLDSLIYFENNEVTSTGLGGLMVIQSSKVTVRNCHLEILDNDLTNEQDPIGMNGGRGGHTIDGNIIIMGNNYDGIEGILGTADASVTVTSTSLTDTRLNMETDYHVGVCIQLADGDTTKYLNITSNNANTFYGNEWQNSAEDSVTTPQNNLAWSISCQAHRDGIQISNIGKDTDPPHTITISNNFMIDKAVLGTSWNNMFYSYGGLGAGDNDIRLLIYNNIFVSRKVHTTVGGITIGRDDGSQDISIFILNNTLITKGTSGGTITNWATDTLVCKNNLLIKDTSTNVIYNFSNDASYRNIDYNRIGNEGLTEGVGVIGSYYDWAGWQGLDFDTSSTLIDASEITFTEKYGLDIADYYTTTGRDSAVDLSATYPFLSTDALGNTRSGSWDMGALEYQASGVIRKKARVVIVQ